MITQENIQILIEEKLSQSDKFLVSVKVKPGNVISVYIDGDKGVSINDCAELSKFIESKLNRDTEDFELEVSSAGISQPLVLMRQYLKNIGRELKVKMKSGVVITGKLTNVSDDTITLEEIKSEKKVKNQTPEPAIHLIPVSDIKEAKIIIKV